MRGMGPGMMHGMRQNFGGMGGMGAMGGYGMGFDTIF